MQQLEIVDVESRRESIEEARLLVERVAERMRRPNGDGHIVSRRGVDVLRICVKYGGQYARPLRSRLM